jgi:hypothetical protein
MHFRDRGSFYCLENVYFFFYFLIFIQINEKGPQDDILRARVVVDLARFCEEVAMSRRRERGHPFLGCGSRVVGDHLLSSLCFSEFGLLLSVIDVR